MENVECRMEKGETYMDQSVENFNQLYCKTTLVMIKLMRISIPRKAITKLP